MHQTAGELELDQWHLLGSKSFSHPMTLGYNVKLGLTTNNSLTLPSLSAATAAVAFCRRFELVLPFLSTPRGLLACSLTSSHDHSLISSHVQRGLQQLLDQLHSNIKRCKQQLCPGELKWLCSRQPGVIYTEPVLQRVVKLLATKQDEPRVQQVVEALVDAGEQRIGISCLVTSSSWMLRQLMLNDGWNPAVRLACSVYVRAPAHALLLSGAMSLLC